MFGKSEVEGEGLGHPMYLVVRTLKKGSEKIPY
jgi:hypothetical protein